MDLKGIVNNLNHWNLYMNYIPHSKNLALRLVKSKSRDET